MCWPPQTIHFLRSLCRVDETGGRNFFRRQPVVCLRPIRAITAFCIFVLLSEGQQPQATPPQQAPAAGRGQGGRGQPDAWAGRKKLLVIADPVEWYGANNYHHQAASHAMAVVE